MEAGEVWSVAAEAEAGEVEVEAGIGAACFRRRRSWRRTYLRGLPDKLDGERARTTPSR